jgi:hypothetical protein
LFGTSIAERMPFHSSTWRERRRSFVVVVREALEDSVAHLAIN